MLRWNLISLLVRIKETRLIPHLMGMGPVEQNLYYGDQGKLDGLLLPDLVFKLLSDHRTFLRLQDGNQFDKKTRAGTHYSGQ